MSAACATLPFSLAVSGRRIVRVLTWIVVLLGIAHLTAAVLLEAIGRDQIHRMGLTVVFDQFNMNEETNLPTYFSSFLLAFGGSLLFLTAALIKRSGGSMLMRWRILGLGFLAMSFDEFASIHEKIGSFITIHTHAPEHGVLHFNWLLAGIPFVLILGLSYVPFVLRLPSSLRNGLVVAGIVYVGAAVGLEMIGSWYSDRFGEENFGYAIQVVVEETTEMAGVILMIRCLLNHISRQVGEIRFVMDGRAEERRQPQVRDIQSPPTQAARAI